MYPIQRACGKTAIIAQTKVTKTSAISIDANKYFLKQNCNGVKAKLKIMLSTNGKTTVEAISFRPAIKKTLPKENAITIYKRVQTGPKSHAGGDQVGLISLAYCAGASLQSM